MTSTSSLSTEEFELLPLSKTYNIKLKFSHTVADGKQLISASEGIDRTGLLVWRGARVFYDWVTASSSSSSNLQENDGRETRNLKDMNIIELGGGLGFGSMITGGILDILLQQQTSTTVSTSVLCTDFFLPALELAQEQILLNTTASTSPEKQQQQNQNLSKIVSTAQLDWCWALSENDEDQQKLDAFCSRHVLTNRLNNELLLLALDCVYPDTRNDVLCGLFVTIAKLLAVKIHQQENVAKNINSLNTSESSFPSLIMTFVERDVGLTLRRLITAASVCGLKVDPITTPVLGNKAHEQELFGRESIVSSSSFNFTDLLMSTSNGNVAQNISEVWNCLNDCLVLRDSAQKKANKNKTDFSCAGATWVLKIQLDQQQHHDDLLSHEGCIQLARKCCQIIESLTTEVNEFISFVSSKEIIPSLSTSASKSAKHDIEESSASPYFEQLSTLLNNGILDANHFNAKWWKVLGYLSFKDTFLAARSLQFAVDDDNDSLSVAVELKLDPLLAQKVLQERKELADQSFFDQVDAEELFS